MTLNPETVPARHEAPPALLDALLAMNAAIRAALTPPTTTEETTHE